MKFHIALLVLFLHNACGSTFDWFGKDIFDTMMDKYSSVTSSNCHKKSHDDLLMPKGAVSMEPRSNQLLDVSTTIFRNRTCLLAMHDLALSRSYYFSLLFKMTNHTDDMWKQPGWEYYYFRQTGLINSFPDCINSSAIYYDYDKHYPNWLKEIPVNKTINTFGPKVYRYDDTRSAWLREPSKKSVRARDIGCGPMRNYTDKGYNVNPWYSIWLPDMLGEDDNLKGSFSVGMKYSNGPGTWASDVYIGHTFFGPPLTRLQDNENVPVKFTQPYFDCGKRNKWLVSAISPIVDSLPRYRKLKDIIEFGESEPTFVATASMSTDWNMIDINPCPEGEGNPSPNIFAGIARCKPTTMCQPLIGWGFARGSYECVCRPGYRYPAWQEGPFQGALIELATRDEYENGFNCLKINRMRVVPSVNYRELNLDNDPSLVNSRKKRHVDVEDAPLAAPKQQRSLASTTEEKQEPGNADKSTNVNFDYKSGVGGKVFKARQKTDFDEILHQMRRDQVYGPKKAVLAEEEDSVKYESPSKSRTRRTLGSQVTDETAVNRMEQIFDHIAKVKQAPDCKKLPVEDLVLPGDVGYGASEQFQFQARTALAMAHFLSGFIQNVDDTSQAWGKLRGDNLLNPDQLHAEVLSHVMADHKIRGFGIWYDLNQYVEPISLTGRRRRQLFAPYAFQQDDLYSSVDMAGDPDVGAYLKTDWFRRSKMRWMNTNGGTSKHKLKPKTRQDTNGTREVEHYHNSVYYKGVKYSVGQWTPPHYACNGYVNDWVITYVTPFFKYNPLEYGTPVFMGVVTVDIKLDYLDIDQCPAPFWTPNAFKDTAYCDYETTYCVPFEGKRLTKGAYRCHCKQGYEYPFIENAWFFAGSFLESELNKKKAGEFSRYDHMKCRTAGATSVHASIVYMIAQTVLVSSILFLRGANI